MKLIQSLLVLVVAALLVILFIDILNTTPVNLLHLFIVIIVIAILCSLYHKYILKMNKIQKIERTLSYNEYIFGSTSQGQFEDYILRNQDLLDNEKLIQTLFRNYFIYHLLVSSENKILCYINKLVTSDVYNKSERMKIILNEAIVCAGFQKFITPCANAIEKANPDGYAKKEIVEIIEKAFEIENIEQLDRLRVCVNSMVDSYIYLYPESKKKIINRFKMKTENKLNP